MNEIKTKYIVELKLVKLSLKRRPKTGLNTILTELVCAKHNAKKLLFIRYKFYILLQCTTVHIKNRMATTVPCLMAKQV